MANGSIIIVDSNMLNSPELLEYFTESKHNKIVLPDYIAIEAYKGDKFENIVSSMETISKYPDQVMVLYGTREITKLKDHADILKWKFINKDHTKSFKDFCRALNQAQKGNYKVKEYVMEHARAANDLVEILLKAGSEVAESFKEIEEGLFDKNEVKIMRKSLQFTPDMMKKIYFMAEKLGNEAYLSHPDHKRPPRTGINEHCFLFRYGVAITFMGVKWIGRGNAQDVKAERMRNDLIDATLVAYATYYDGLLTRDKDMMWLDAMTNRFLDVISQRA